MVRPFLAVVALLILSAGAVMGHYWYYDRTTPQTQLDEAAALTQIVSPALSVSFYEPRVFLYENASNPAYPQMQPINRMDFVYAE